MVTTQIDELYEERIRPLSRAARLHLLARIAQELAKDPEENQLVDLRDLEGVGAEIWQGVDVEAYINEMRDEWDRT